MVLKEISAGKTHTENVPSKCLFSGKTENAGEYYRVTVWPWGMMETPWLLHSSSLWKWCSLEEHEHHGTWARAV